MKLQKYFTLCFIVCFIVGCRKDHIISPQNVDIYVVGNTTTSTTEFVATFWKNGIEQALADSKSNSIATAIAVNGKDVYIVGNSSNGAVYWKNGILMNTFPSAEFNAITANGNDIYIAGNTVKNGTNVATIWKNGVPNGIDSLTESYANSIFLNGNDVYVAGITRPSNSTYKAAILENGVITNLTDGTYWAEAKAVFVNGSDVYVAGFISNSYNNDIATVWKNGSATMLTGNSFGEANAIFMHGNDLYITGYAQNNTNIYVAKLWKNSVATDLSNGIDESYASAIAIHGSDIFVAGFSGYPNASTSIYWKNGSAVILPNSLGTSSQTAGIAIVPH